MTSATPPASPQILLQQYETELHDAYAQGTYQPIVFPYHWIGILPVVFYLFLEPAVVQNLRLYQYSSFRNLVHVYRYASFAFFVGWSVRAMQSVRSPTPHAAYGVGLINAWSIIWLASLIVFNDVKEFKRIWPIEDAPGEDWAANGKLKAEAVANGKGVNGDAIGGDQSGERLRKRAKMTEKPEQQESAKLPKWSSTELQYYWQSIPSTLGARAHWLLDLTTSMRGPGWLHQARSIPAPPADVLAALPLPHPTAKPTVRGFSDRRTLLKHNLRILALTYLGLDVLKNVAMRDPYFWGFVSASPLPISPFASLSHFPLLAYRCLLSLCAVGTALSGIFSLNALVFSGPLGPRYLGIRAAAWVYPEWWASPSWLASRGLAGWWGAWWHQIFRFGFEAPSVWACGRLGWDRRSPHGQAIGVVTAFTCSGILHAAGSYTVWPSSRPVTGSFAFFILQAVGVLAEGAVTRWLEKQGVLKRMPWLMKRASTALWVLIWMTITSPLLVDDFARSGIWLFEPVPFSFVRLIGWGLPGQGAWAWRGKMVWWHQGNHWWQSGIAF